MDTPQTDGYGGPQTTSEQRQAEILHMLHDGKIPSAMRRRLESSAAGTSPWIATLTPAELRIARSHGIKPIAAIAATCWLQYGWSWTLGHTQGWHTALQRLRQEAMAAGANAILDVKLRTIPLAVPDSMDFTLVGTAVSIAGLPPSAVPIVATVPALEFVKLLEADIVPTGIAIGAHYEWLTDYYGSTNLTWMGNIESTQLSNFTRLVRANAFQDLRKNARTQGNGVLAHVNFTQMFEIEAENQPKRYLARHIVVATTVDAGPAVALTHDIGIVVDMHAGQSPLAYSKPHHQSYGTNEEEGAI